MKLVDTNVVAYLLIEGDRTVQARQLYAADPDWRSDGFLFVEFANVIATYVRAKALTLDQGSGLLGEAERRVTLVPAQTGDHAAVLELAATLGVSAYDARFILVARSAGARLVTEDAALRTAAPQWTQSLREAL